jgi:acyl carrier protein
MNNTVTALVHIMRTVAGPDLPGPIDPTGNDSIRRLGLTSVRLLEFMVAVEDTLGVLWGEDTEPAVLESFQAMADHLTPRLPASSRRAAATAPLAGEPA